jgi:hypothetical protein
LIIRGFPFFKIHLISEFGRVIMIALERIEVFIHIYKKYFYLFLLVLLLPISADSLFYKSIEKLIIENTAKYSQAMLEHLAYLVNSVIEKTEMLPNYISTISVVLLICNATIQYFLLIST